MERVSIVVEEIKGRIKDNYLSLMNNEALTRWLLIDDYLLSLGYSKEDIVVEKVYSFDSVVKLDYEISIDNKPRLIVEAKSYGSDLKEFYGQIEGYYRYVSSVGNYRQGELTVVLTDGDLYMVYSDTQVKGELDRFPYIVSRISTGGERLESLGKFSLSLDSSNVSAVVEYDLSEYYRVDELQGLYDYYNSLGVKLKLQEVNISGEVLKCSELYTVINFILRNYRGRIKRAITDGKLEFILEENGKYRMAVSKESIKLVQLEQLIRSTAGIRGVIFKYERKN